MALPVLPNTTNFLGVALVINRSSDGPRFVFHYPPRILPPSSSPDRATDGIDTLDEDDDLLLGRPSRQALRESGSASALLAAELAQWNHDDHLVTESGTQVVPWEHVAGFPTKDLENILTPARAYHKKLFQVSLDPIHCVSYPICAPENGVWRKKKAQKAQKQRQPSHHRESAGSAGTGTDPAPALPRSTGDRGSTRDLLKPLTKVVEEPEDKKKSNMTMFNLVFFLSPKKHEGKPLVDIMFTHIIKKINKAYKYCQQRSDFVWKESKRIIALKDKGREDKRKLTALWDDILSISSLAASMQDLYEAVSHNRIAALQLDTIEGLVTHSVQIPVPFHVSDLPQEGEDGRPGLWLTTANSLMAEEAAENPGFLDKSFALLLMMDEKRVTAELRSDPDETTLAMIEFVRHCKPTLSFHQVCQQSSNVLTPAQVRKFAQHFIFWRRAIAIPPLHARDMYIVSPNCDLRRLPQAATQWARQFPLSPTLPNFLAELSVAPRPYKLHCPSKAHRPVYMAMLAWLMRGGWVTQLCTFAYVVVWPEIIYEVEHALEAEDIARAKRVQNLGREPGGADSDDALATPTTARAAPSSGVAALGDPAVAAFASGFLPLNFDIPDSTSSTTASLRDLSLSHSQSSIIPAATSTPTSPSFTRHPSSSAASPQPPTPTPTPEPTPAEKAAEKARLARIAAKAARGMAERATAHARKTPPQQTVHPSVNHARHLEGIAPHIILDAKKATGKESLYLSAIAKRFRDRVAAKQAPATAASGSSPNASNNKTRRTEPPAFPNLPAKRPGPNPTTATTTTTISNSNSNNSTTHPTTSRGFSSTTTTSGAAFPQQQQQHGASGGGTDWDERVANAFPVFCKYLNGRSALERIALQEDMKRKDVWNLLTGMSEYLICVRHW
ncbi:nitrogen permease regulator 3 [Staphylotrichum tortipilum]|uniref:Nitrogen permease regulator 3 n=1 Tax=Staphylotrichum tortipilum TaxID=2831512 RepID=A0AAN6RVB4_9PEZI|nr:nitrogen permease regulator 3 [Staphylotrichum longicolle]